MRNLSLVGAASGLMLAALVLVSACGDDDGYLPYDVVGSECRGDLDCAPGVQCEHGKDFGDGTCTFACRDHFDCPAGAACVDRNDGVCLIQCFDDSYCRPGFHCKARHNRSGGGDSLICAK